MALQFRYGVDADWESTNSNIVEGEPAVATDTERAFVGTDSGEFMELANIASVAPAYDSSVNYVVGNVVSHLGKLYVCRSDTTGAWNGDCWEEITLADTFYEAGLTNYEAVSASGDIVSFEGNGTPLKDLRISITAQQDLHGYGAPWVGGAGANILPPMVDGTYEGNGVKAVVKDGIATLSGTTTSSGNALIIPLAETITAPASFYCHMGNSVANASFAPAIENSANTSQNVSYACSPANRITGDITDKAGQTYDRIRIYLVNGVTISGTFAPMFLNTATAQSNYIPYSNICPISGWDEVKVCDDGKYAPFIKWNQNISDPKFENISATTGWRAQGGSVNGATGGIIDVSFSGSSFGSNQLIYPITLINGHTFYSSVEVYAPDTTHTYWLVGGSTGALVDRRELTTVGWHKMEGIWTYATYSYWMFRNYSGGAVSNVKLKNPMVYDLTEMFGAGNEPATVADFKALFPKDYYPYNAGEVTCVSAVNGEPYRLYTIDLDGTRYGGTLDVTTGKMTLTHFYAVLDGSTTGLKVNGVANYTQNSRFEVYYNTKLKQAKYAGASTFCLCDRVNPSYNYTIGITTNTPPTYAVFPHSSAFFLTLPRSDFDTVEKANMWLQSNNLQVCYELKAPQEIQLTATQVRSLLGQNNVFCDTGTIENLTYRIGGGTT